MNVNFTGTSVIPRSALFVAFCLLFLNFAYFYQGGGPNQYSRYALTASLAEHGSVRIDDFHRLTIDKAKKDGHFFSDKPPGLSLLGVPIYFIVQQVAGPLFDADQGRRNVLLYLLTLLTVSLPVALAMTSFFRRAWEEAGPRAAFWVTLGLALGSPLTVYASLYYSHALCAALLWFSFDLVTREDDAPSVGRCAFAGLLAGWANLSEMPTGLITLCLLAYLFFAYRFAWKQTMGFVFGGLPALWILLFYNWSAFGDPFANGYQYCYIDAFREAMSQGFMGVGWPTWEAFVGIFVGPSRGLLLHWPFFFFCVLPALALLVYRREVRGSVLLALIILVVYFVFGCSYFLWSGGAAYGPRHLIPCFPFAGYLVVRAADRMPRFLIPTFAIISTIIVSMSIATMAEFPEAAPFPLLQVVLRSFVRGELSLKIIGDEGRMGMLMGLQSDDPRFFDAVNLGEMLGLRGVASLVPLIVVSVILAVIGWRQHCSGATDSPGGPR